MHTLFGEKKYECFINSSQFQCLFNTETQRCVYFNNSMLKHMNIIENFEIDVVVIANSVLDKYVTIFGIPCRLRHLTKLEDDNVIMEIFPSRTKMWRQTEIDIFDLTSDGIWEWYPSVGFEYMSIRFWDIFGYDQMSMPESPDSWMSLVKDLEEKKLAFKGMEEHIESKGNKPYKTTLIYRHKKGHDITVLCRGSVVEWLPDGGPWKIVGAHTDVTNLIENDKGQAQEVFTKMAHEIRSPICTIINECELLDIPSKTNVILDTCNQLCLITDNILNLKDAINASLSLKKQKVDLYDLISRCVKRHRLESKKKSISISLNVSFEKTAMVIVEVDIGKFNQILDNLINNSIKYTECNGKIKIDVEYDKTSSVCSIKVIDTGRGINREQYEDIFIDYVQVDETISGVGIGLTLAKRLSNIMDGDVIVYDSEPGRGTTMLFTSKLKLYELEKTKINILNKTLRILLVDDILVNRKIMKRFIDGLRVEVGVDNYMIVEASNGKEAIEKFKEANGNFQLVFMDCLMPILDGFKSTVAIQYECECLGIEPVIVVGVTAGISPSVTEKCIESGMKLVIEKPYSKKDLLLSLRIAMGV
jgi:CheY-like chemotaxis protein